MKQTYVTPEVVVHGIVEDITQGIDDVVIGGRGRGRGRDRDRDLGRGRDGHDGVDGS